MRSVAATLFVSFLSGVGGQARADSPQILESRGLPLAIAPDLVLDVGYRLSVSSGAAHTELPLPYGSDRTGFVSELDRVALWPDGRLDITYRDYCNEAAAITQKTTIGRLRAQLLMEQAETKAGPVAEALVERALTWDATEPGAAVAAARRAKDPARAEQLLAPALTADRFATYFEMLRSAPTLRHLPALRSLRTPQPGRARIHPERGVQALSGSILALSISYESEADCPTEVELVLFDVLQGQVVFRRPYMAADWNCHHELWHQTELNQLLSDLGFDPVPDRATVEYPKWPYPKLAFKRAGYTLTFGEKYGELKRGERVVASGFDPLNALRVGYLLPSLNTLVVLTNRNSDTCEGWPSIETLRYAAP